MKILLLFGGNSTEREVSIRSGQAVLGALKNLGHEVVEYDPVDNFAGLSDLAKGCEIALPIMHGTVGEDGQVQNQLEKVGLKYLGTNSKNSKLFINKAEFKKTISALGISTPKFEIVNKDSFNVSKLREKPFVLKPINGGSSIDTFVIRDFDDDPIPSRVFDEHPKMILEELVLGDEVTVPVLGDKALPVIEIIPPPGKEFDYENKYNGQTQELCPPVNISQINQQKSQKIATKIHKKLGAKDISRTDMIIDSSGSIFVLELNTMPGLTSQSLYPKSAQAVGISFEELVERFVEMALDS